MKVAIRSLPVAQQEAVTLFYIGTYSHSVHRIEQTLGGGWR
jgi:hypothetical protein